MGPIEGDATPFDLDFEPDSAAVSHRSSFIFALGRILKVKLIGFESSRDKLSNKKRSFAQFRV
jgi:hypothetical protein